MGSYTETSVKKCHVSCEVCKGWQGWQAELVVESLGADKKCHNLT